MTLDKVIRWRWVIAAVAFVLLVPLATAGFDAVAPHGTTVKATPYKPGSVVGGVVPHLPSTSVATTDISLVITLVIVVGLVMALRHGIHRLRP